MEKEFQSIGIGCYYQNGHYYWVQCFSSEEGSPVSSAEEAKQLCGDTASLDNDGQVTMKISGAKLKPGKKSLVLSWSKINGVKGYQIQISTGKAFSKSKRSEYTASASKKSYSIKKLKGKRLKAKKKYYVRIRAYQLDSEGGKTFGKWKVLNAKTK